MPFNGGGKKRKRYCCGTITSKVLKKKFDKFFERKEKSKRNPKRTDKLRRDKFSLSIEKLYFIQNYLAPAKINNNELYIYIYLFIIVIVFRNNNCNRYYCYYYVCKKAIILEGIIISTGVLYNSLKSKLFNLCNKSV